MFVATINNAHRQMLKRVGIYLSSPAFSHGQLYVAFSRASSFENVTVAIIERHQQVMENDSDNVKHCLSRSALKFQKHKQMFVKFFPQCVNYFHGYN
jgi:hypothetical protein